MITGLRCDGRLSCLKPGVDVHFQVRVREKVMMARGMIFSVDVKRHFILMLLDSVLMVFSFITNN